MANPRKPSHLKVVTGTSRPDRANPHEPTPHRTQPRPPRHLSADARKAWRQFADLLDDMGVLTVADAVALESLCECYAEIVRLRAALAARGADTYETMTTTGGLKVQPYPEVAMIGDADRRLRAWLGLFGLTPADRARVSASGNRPAEANPFALLG